MVRLALVIVALCGCDVVFQVEEVHVEPAACGPYESITEVPIIGVSEPRQFSVRQTASETLALVVGTDKLGTHPIPLRWNGAAWEPDPVLNTISPDLGFVGATLAPAEPTPELGNYTGPIQPAMLAWGGTPQQLARYFWTGTSWDKDVNQLPISEPDYEVRAGNVVLVTGPGGSNDRVRHTMVLEIARNSTVVNRLLLHANTPPSFTLMPKLSRTLTLDQLELELGQGVITEDQTSLVYSVESGGKDLYATRQDVQRVFGKGGPILSVNTADDEVEPWIDETCSKLYFRRTPAGLPNAAGTIFVAE